MSGRKRIVILGRPNVGKSTLFNRLVGFRKSLVHDEPGVTRDRIEHPIEWFYEGTKIQALLVDTGGLGHEKFGEEIRLQVEAALTVADGAILLFDGQEGLTSGDRDLVRELKKRGVDRKIPLLITVNKIDADSHEARGAEFYELGFDDVITIAAEHGRGIDDLTDKLTERLGGVEAFAQEGETQEEEEPTIARIAIVGRPNVGKSTLVNTLLGEERMITSPIAGTTVDAVDSLVELGGKQFVFVDTAGIRRKSKTEQGVEVLSVVQAKKALERAEVAILLLNGEEGITDQDEKIGGLIEEAGCSVVLAVNKWDTQRKNPKFTKEAAAEMVRKQMGYLKYAPIIFVSGKEKTGFRDLGGLLEEITHQRRLKIPTHEFTEWVRKEATIHNPQNAKFFMCHQAGRHPPTFVCHVSDPKKIHFSLKRYLVNALRDRWGFMGTPVRMLFVTGKPTK